MDVDKLPDLKPPDFGQVLDADRPVLSFAWHRTGRHRAASHSHPRGHIVHVVEGAYWVETPEGTWLAPTGQAVWIPPYVHHQIYAHDTVRARMLFVDPSHSGMLPALAGTVRVSSFLAELIMRAVDLGNAYGPVSPAARLAMVLLDELCAMRPSPLLIPISKEPRLARALQRMIAQPGGVHSIDDLADCAATSPRTLARLFKSEFGMTLSQWRTRLQLVESVERLARGASVTEVALELGFASSSSFAFMFRRHMGSSPGKFRSE